MSPERCDRCGHPRDEWTRQCKYCHTEFWCRWNADWYKGRLTRISIGQDIHGRKFGVLFALVATVLLVYGVALKVYYAEAESQDIGPLLAIFIGGYATYEVWAYFCGRATSVDHMIHEPRPENTLWRTVGLAGDLALFAFACVMLYDLQ